MSATTQETWLYAGQRLGKGDRVIHAWVDEEGTERCYSKLKASVIGGAYGVGVERDDDNVRVSTTIAYLADAQREPTAGQLVEWRAEDAATRGTLDAKRAEKRAAADDEVEAALEVLRRHHAAIKTYGTRWAFAQHCAGEIARPPRDV